MITGAPSGLMNFGLCYYFFALQIIGVGTGGGAAGAAAPPTLWLGGYLFAPQLFAIELNSNFEVYVNFYR